jgi:hypothetical protein
MLQVTCKNPEHRGFMPQTAETCRHRRHPLAVIPTENRCGDRRTSFDI